MQGMRYGLVVILLLSPWVALADEDTELAKRYYNLGEELYNRSDYEGALKQFQQSYKLSQRPALLYNMARCQESLGQYEKAIELYNGYLKSKPDNPSTIEARIANLQKLLKKKQEGSAPQPSPPVKGEPVKAEPSQPPGGAHPPGGAGPAVGEPLPPPQGEPSRPSRPYRIPGWVLVGTGGALLVTGIVLGAMAASKAKDLEQANKSGKEWAEYADVEQSGRTLNKAGIATLALGGAAAATGIVLLILDMKAPKEERRAWLTPSLAPGGAVVSGGVQF
jgi:hypothetical protein